MNPFDLAGPQFLLFYLALGGIALAVLVWARRLAEAGLPRVRLSDPYTIAYLRGGKNEALRVATVSLVDRGLLTASGDRLESSAVAGHAVAARPLEKALLRHFAGGASGASVFTSPDLEAATADIEQTLKRHGLIPDEACRRARLGRAVFALGLLWGVGLIKLFVALSRGRHNVGFLILLSLIFGVLALVVSSPRRTRAGDEMLADLRTLFRGLRERRAALEPEQAEEASLLAAVFGLSALPLAGWAYTRKLYPRAASGVTSCGASCGVSCGSSCGSSCGGVCGGGCGGCGGCGG